MPTNPTVLDTLCLTEESWSQWIRCSVYNLHNEYGTYSENDALSFNVIKCRPSTFLYSIDLHCVRSGNLGVLTLNKAGPRLHPGFSHSGRQVWVIHLKCCRIFRVTHNDRVDRRRHDTHENAGAEKSRQQAYYKGGSGGVLKS